MRWPAWEQWLEDSSAHRAVQLAHPIDHDTAPQSQDGHIKVLIEVLGILTTKSQQLVQGEVEVPHILAEIAADQVRAPGVEASADGGMRREYVARSGRPPGSRKRLADLVHEASSPFQHHKGRMALVQMAYLNWNTQRPQHPPSADPQHHFLEQTDLAPAIIQFARDAPVSSTVQRIIAV